MILRVHIFIFLFAFTTRLTFAQSFDRKDSTYYSKLSVYAFGDFVKRSGIGIDFSPNLKYDIDTRFSIFYQNAFLAKNISVGDFFYYSGVGLTLHPKYFPNKSGKGFYIGLATGISYLHYKAKQIDYYRGSLGDAEYMYTARQNKTTTLFTIPTPTMIGFKGNDNFIGIDVFLSLSPVKQNSKTTITEVTPNYYIGSFSGPPKIPYETNSLNEFIDFKIDFMFGVKITFGLKRKSVKTVSYYKKYVERRLFAEYNIRIEDLFKRSGPFNAISNSINKKKEQKSYYWDMKYTYNDYWKNEIEMLKQMDTLVTEIAKDYGKK